MEGWQMVRFSFFHDKLSAQFPPLKSTITREKRVKWEKTRYRGVIGKDEAFSPKCSTHDSEGNSSMLQFMHFY